LLFQLERMEHFINRKRIPSIYTRIPYRFTSKAIANRFVLHNGIEEKLFGYFEICTKFGLNWESVLLSRCPCGDRPKFSQSCHLHSLAKTHPFGRESERMGSWPILPDAVAVVNNLLCAYWQYIYVYIYIYLRLRRGWNSIVKLWRYHRLSTWVLNEKLLARDSNNNNNNMHKNCLFNLLEPKQIA